MVMHEWRQAMRGLVRTPVFAVTAVVTLALATAAVATVFTLANALFFRPLASSDPDRVVLVSTTRRHGTQVGWISYPDYVSVRDRTKTLDALAAHYATAPLWASANGHMKELDGTVVSASFFELLGARPALGRFFHGDEDRVPDRDRVAVIGHSLWRDWFDSSPTAIGATLTINGTPFTIVGVASASFRGVAGPKQVYIPMTMLRVGYRFCDGLTDPECTCLGMIGRLAPGRTLDDARAEMTALVPPRWAQAPEDANTGLEVSYPRGSGRRPEPHDVRLMTLLAMVSAVLLLVSCANLAGLFIARGSAQVRELAIRASLGASRGRLVRQVLRETVLLAIASGGLAVLLAIVLTNALASRFYTFDSEGYARHFDFRVDPIVLVAVLAASLLAGALVGLLPALRATRIDPGESLKRQSTTVSAQGGLGRWLVGIQAAVAVALAAVAALLMASAHILAADINMDARHVALIRLRPRLVGYSPEKAQRFLRDAIAALEATPGVESISLHGFWDVRGKDQRDVSVPAASINSTNASATRDVVRVRLNRLGPRTFATLGIPMRRGREFDDREAGDPRVLARLARTGASGLSPAADSAIAIVNEALARRLWPTTDPLAESFVMDGRTYQVIGVVADVLLTNRTDDPWPYVYVPARSEPERIDARLNLRVKGDPATMLPRLVQEVNRVDPAVPVTETITLPFQFAHGQLEAPRMSATFVSYAAGLAVLLCGVGLYGTLAFSVSRRTKEIGIRQAIGATPRGILMMIVREGLVTIVIGAGAGIALAIAGTGLVRHLLYGSSGADPLFYSAAATLVLAVGLFACWLPARRAAGIEPLAALRDE